MVYLYDHINIFMQLKKNARSLVFCYSLYEREVIVMSRSIWIYFLLHRKRVMNQYCAFSNGGDRYRLDISKKN